jgi:barstar (barnase inhibitor)
MAPFDPRALDRDYRLMMNTCVTLYSRTAVLDEAVGWLDAYGYQVARMDASAWRDETDFHTAVATALDFPDYYGHNLPAFNDCMRDVIVHEYGWPPQATGLAVVFTGYDAFVRADPRAAYVVLDILAGQSRSALLFGGRLICLVQTDDPDIDFEQLGFGGLGSVWPMWNDRE